MKVRIAVIAAAILALLVWVGVCAAETEADTGYAELLFDPSYVHTIDIDIDDWDGFLLTCPEEKFASCTITVDGEAYENCAIRAKGNTSISLVQAFEHTRYSFKVSFGKYEKDRYYHGLDKVCLNNLFQDSTLMKDYLCYALMNKTGVPAPLCSYVRINVNGEYWGLYIAVEDTDKGFRNRCFGGEGVLYKPESDNWADDDMYLRYIDDDPESYPNIFDNAKTKVKDKDKTRLIGALQKLNGADPESAVDAEEVMRYFVVNTFAVNQDSYTGITAHNYVLHEQNGIMRMIPWDYNMAFRDDVMTGRTDEENASVAVNFPIDTPVTGTAAEERPMLAWIVTDETRKEQYHALFREFMENVYDSGWLQEEIDRVWAMIDPYVQTDPTLFIDYGEVTKGVAALKQYCDLRCRSIAGQLDGSIPTTFAGQEEHPETLVDTTGFTLSDLGRKPDGTATGNFSE